MNKKLQLRAWVITHMLPYCRCEPTLIAASHYADPQSAWNAWTVPDEMLDALFRTGFDSVSNIACDLVKPSLIILASRTSKGDYYRDVIRAAIRQPPGFESFYHDFISELRARVLEIKRPLGARYAAFSVYQAFKSCYSPRKILAITHLVRKAVLASVDRTLDGRSFPCRLINGIPNKNLSDDAVNEWMCRRIRKQVPFPPVDNSCNNIFGSLLLHFEGIQQ